MNYTIRINEVADQGSQVRAFASLTFGGSFKVTNVAVVESKEGGVFVSMPRFKSGERTGKNEPVYKDICNPITAEFRKELYDNILEAYGYMKETGKKEASMRVNEKEGLEYTVAVSPFEREGSNIRGLGRIYFGDAFMVNNVSILQGKEAEFVSMPSHKTGKVDSKGKAEYADICFPVTKEFREELFGEILNTYYREKASLAERGAEAPQMQGRYDGSRTEREPVFR